MAFCQQNMQLTNTSIKQNIKIVSYKMNNTNKQYEWFAKTRLDRSITFLPDLSDSVMELH